MPSTAATHIDLREFGQRHRQALIASCFDTLRAGDAVELLFDHDPTPLRHHFEDRAPGGFEWSPLEAGPDLWRVRIAKVKAVAAAVAAESGCAGGACCA